MSFKYNIFLTCVQGKVHSSIHQTQQLHVRKSIDEQLLEFKGQKNQLMKNVWEINYSFNGSKLSFYELGVCGFYFLWNNLLEYMKL